MFHFEYKAPRFWFLVVSIARESLLGLAALTLLVWVFRVGLLGLTARDSLVFLASLAIALLTLLGLDSRRRLEIIQAFGISIVFVAGGAVVTKFILDEFTVSTPSPSWWLLFILMGLGPTLVAGARFLMERSRLLFNLSGHSSLLVIEGIQELFDEMDAEALRGRQNLIKEIKVEAYSVMAQATQYGTSNRHIGRLFIQHHAGFPCVIRAQKGSVEMYDTSAFETWMGGKGTWRRKSYHDYPFRVPGNVKFRAVPPRKSVRLHGEVILPPLQRISTKLKGEPMEITSERVSVLLKTHELSGEQLINAVIAVVEAASLLRESSS